MQHTTKVIEVKAIDGTLPPSRAKLAEHVDQRYEPHEKGHVHAIGEPREVTKFEWVCSCGATSNGKSGKGLPFGTKEAALSAGKTHEKQLFRPPVDKDAFTWTPEDKPAKKPKKAKAKA